MMIMPIVLLLITLGLAIFLLSTDFDKPRNDESPQ